VLTLTPAAALALTGTTSETPGIRHASITTTLDLYGHLDPGEMDRYADRLDQGATDADAARMRPDDAETGLDSR
jgi:hypothetical protein